MRYDIIAFVLMSVIVIASMLVSLYLYNKKQKMLKTIVDLYTANTALEDMISSQALSNVEPIEQSDGFVKFLSESREWAFNYIDNVQNTILVLKEEYDNKKAIDKTLNKLFEMLPDNNKEK
jgi:hypothetical protein